MGPMSTVELLKDYRILCKLAKAIPSPPIREETLKEIRKLFREYYEKNQLEQLEKFCQSKLFWLKCTIPKQLWPRCVAHAASEEGDGMTKTFVVRSGKLEQTSCSSSYEYKSTIDPDDLRRHQELLRRMRFGRP